MIKKWMMLSLLALVGTMANAEIVTIAPSQGRLLNYTSLPNEMFEVRFSASCMTSRMVRCGDFEQTIVLKPDGTYEVPAIALDAGATSPSDRNYSLFVSISIPEDHPERPKGIAPKGLSELVRLRRATPAQLVAPNFTLFASQPAILDVKLASGKDFADYVKNEGRDEGVRILLDFGLRGGRSTDQTHEIDQTGFSRLNWSEVRAQYFMTRGEFAADAPFDFVVTSGSKEIKSGRARFAADLIPTLGTLILDDTESSANPAERRLTGIFADSYFQLDYGLEDQFELSEIGWSYATLNAECLKGKIAGELIFREGQFTSDKETFRVPVRGDCTDDSGEIIFALKRKGGAFEEILARYDRIFAQDREGRGGRKYVHRRLVSADVQDRMSEYAGEELTMFMPAYFADGTFAGKLQVATED